MQKRAGFVASFALLIVITVILLSQFVAAESIAESLLSKFTNLNIDFSFDTISEQAGIARLLFFLLVALIVFAVAEYLPFLGKDHQWVAAGVSVIIAALSVLWISNEEIYTILLSYTTLGIVITGIIPWLAIAGISKKAFDQGHFFLGKMLWVAYIVVSVVRILGAESSELSDPLLYTYVSLIALAIVMMIIERKVYFFMSKEEMQGRVDISKRTAMLNALGDEATARRRAAALREAGNHEAAEEIEQYADYMKRRAQGKQ